MRRSRPGSRLAGYGHDAMTERTEALVVFVDRTECWWLRRLAPGFRHCFALLRRGEAWLVCDPLKARIALELLRPPPELDLGAWYARQGHHVLRGYSAGPSQRTPLLRPLTCVEVVKRLLGLHAPFVLTPRQLFDHLRSHPPEPFCPIPAPPGNGGVDREEK